jgi:hypothetical protein
VLQRAGVVPVVGKLIAARMPQHVRMQLEKHPGGLAKPLDEMVEADGAHAIADEVIQIPSMAQLRLYSHDRQTPKMSLEFKFWVAHIIGLGNHPRHREFVAHCRQRRPMVWSRVKPG